MTLREIAHLLGVSEGTVKVWKDHGLLVSHEYNHRNQFLYERPGDNPPRKMQGLKGKLSNRPRLLRFQQNHTNEAQYEA